MPFFSVIIPTHNRAGLVAATLDSVFAQTLGDFEVIVVDDGSTDATLAVVARYGQRVNILRQQNRGPGAARNAGLAQATGEYAAFLDSDDLWFPWTLATLRQVIRDQNSPSFIVSDPLRFSDEATVHAALQGPLDVRKHRDYFAADAQPYMVSASAMVVKTDVLRSVGGFAEHRHNAEDADTYLRLGEAPGFVHLRSPHLFAYREHGASLVADVGKTFAGVNYLIAQEKAGRYPGGDARRWERRRIICYHVRPVSLRCLHASASRKGWWLYRRSFFWHLRLGRFRYLAGFLLLACRRGFSYDHGAKSAG